MNNNKIMLFIIIFFMLLALTFCIILALHLDPSSPFHERQLLNKEFIITGTVVYIDTNEIFIDTKEGRFCCELFYVKDTLKIKDRVIVYIKSILVVTLDKIHEGRDIQDYHEHYTIKQSYSIRSKKILRNK